MKHLDISSCPMLTGNIPSEIGQLTNLKYLNIGGCRFNGTFIYIYIYIYMSYAQL
jgi:hypothetical protein